jgi:hypothetical protein
MPTFNSMVLTASLSVGLGVATAAVASNAFRELCYEHAAFAEIFDTDTDGELSPLLPGESEEIVNIIEQLTANDTNFRTNRDNAERVEILLEDSEPGSSKHTDLIETLEFFSSKMAKTIREHKSEFMDVLTTVVNRLEAIEKRMTTSESAIVTMRQNIAEGREDQKEINETLMKKMEQLVETSQKLNSDRDSDEKRIDDCEQERRQFQLELSHADTQFENTKDLATTEYAIAQERAHDVLAVAKKAYESAIALASAEKFTTIQAIKSRMKANEKQLSYLNRGARKEEDA